MKALCLWPGSAWQCLGVGLRGGFHHKAARITRHKRPEMQLPITADAQGPCTAAQLRRGRDPLWLARGMIVITRGVAALPGQDLQCNNARQRTSVRSQRLPTTAIPILGANITEKGQLKERLSGSRPVDPCIFFCTPLFIKFVNTPKLKNWIHTPRLVALGHIALHAAEQAHTSRNACWIEIGNGRLVSAASIVSKNARLPARNLSSS